MEVGLSTSASEKVRGAAEKEMPEKVEKKEGRCVSGAKGGECEVQESLPSTEAPQLHTGHVPYLWMRRFLLCRNLPVRGKTRA